MPFESPSSAFGTFSRRREKGVNQGDIAADGLMAMACAQEVRIDGFMTVRGIDLRFDKPLIRRWHLLPLAGEGSRSMRGSGVWLSDHNSKR